MASDPKFLLWVDLETTGTDENLDGILEIGAIITTPDLDRVADWHRVIGIEPQHHERLLDNEFVYSMHEHNGLLDDCATSFWKIEEADRDLAHDMAFHGEPHDYMLAGSGVGHFDRRFIRRHLPRVESMLQYPVIDVGVIRRTMRMWAGEGLDFKFNESKDHRAMGDIELHLNEALAYRSLFRQWGRAEVPSPHPGLH